ncbi:MAG: DUF4249 domain-containing protein [Bacteroidetes bacterium]|nr:DUF4249 domain-containing protein [Bacteroidota bacterium]
MTTINISILYLLAVTIIISACEMVVDIDMPDHKPVLVINSLFNSDSIFRVAVSHSIGIQEDASDITNIENATIEILENNISLGSLSWLPIGFYTNPLIKITAGASYEIRVSAGDYPAVTSTNTIPLAKMIIIKQVKDSVKIGEAQMEQYVTEVTIEIPDQAAEVNFYAIQIYAEDTFYSSWDDSVWVNSYFLNLSTRDPVLGQTEEYTQMLKFSDELFNGKNYSAIFYFEETDKNSIDSVFLYFYSLSSSYYYYSVTKDLYYRTHNNPFSEPVQVYTNIENGLGIFAGRCGSRIALQY